jgi:NadR type nicotinamide-nucleotide adenylyltransferase
MTHRLVLTGPESTGKTTLAAELGARLGAPVVPEFVRTFAAQKGAPITFADHGPIVRGQVALEEAALAATPPLVVCDTDLVSTVVYCEHYFGRCPPWIEQLARARRADRYLLCLPDLPWVPDGIRDQPHARDALLARFAAALDRFGADWTPVGGAGPARLDAALRAVAPLLAPPAGPPDGA